MQKINFKAVANYIVENELNEFRNSCDSLFEDLLEGVYNLNKKFTRGKILSHIYNRARVILKTDYGDSYFFEVIYKDAFNQFKLYGEFDPDRETPGGYAVEDLDPEYEPF